MPSIEKSKESSEQISPFKQRVKAKMAQFNEKHKSKIATTLAAYTVMTNVSSGLYMVASHYGVDINKIFLMHGPDMHSSNMLKFGVAAASSVAISVVANKGHIKMVIDRLVK